MRSRLFIGLLGLFVLLAACHRPTLEGKRLVRRAERLADSMPDSALRLIDSMMQTPLNFTERQRMDMALLQSEIVFRNASFDDVDFLDSINTYPELERAAAYFAQKKQYAKAAHAALYSGRIQQHYNEKETAMRSFKEAEEYGKHTCDSLTIAQAEYWMGKMLLDDNRIREALSSFYASEGYIGNRFAEQAYIENCKAVIYILLQQYDSAEYYLQHSMEYAELVHSNKVRLKTLNNYTVLYRLQGNYDQAIASLRQMEDFHSLEDTERLMLYLNLGNVFFNMKEADSAAKYYQCLEELLPAVDVKNETKVSAYGALSKHAENQGNTQLALQFRERHEHFLYEVMRQGQEQAIYRILKQYDYEGLLNQMHQEHTRMHHIIILGIILLFCVTAILLFRFARRKRKEAEANANLFHFMQQNKALVESNMVHERKASDAMQQLSDLLYTRLKAMQKLDYCLKNPIDKIALKDLEKEVFGNGEHWEAIKEVLSALYPGLWESLILKYPDIDEMERRVYMLSRLKFSRLGEATLLGISTSVLDKLRTKVRKRMDQENMQ